MDPKGTLIIDHEVAENDEVTLFISGDLDIQTAPLLKNFINKVLNEGAANINLDLSKLSYLDSSGYGVLVDAKRRSGRTECNMNMSSLPPWITEFFDMSALNP